MIAAHILSHAVDPNELQSTTAPTVDDITAQPYLDHAERILTADPRLTDEERADLWSRFHEAKDPDALAAQLQTVAAPEDLKHALWTAKRVTAPAPSPVDKVTGVAMVNVNRVGKIRLESLARDEFFNPVAGCLAQDVKDKKRTTATDKNINLWFGRGAFGTAGIGHCSLRASQRKPPVFQWESAARWFLPLRIL